LRHAGGHVGSGQPLMCPDPEIARAFDYEGEMAIIIGKSNMSEFCNYVSNHAKDGFSSLGGQTKSVFGM
jgi:2-keto-4-pentenoate hydratase/2-oxohepta-3-ene-1,7-dioic acid hydratase in catechol pathway